jgi:hypothetical protein
MIDVIAMVLSVIGTPLIATESHKKRLCGFILWILGNSLWIVYGLYIAQSLAVVAMFSWYQIWCIVGVIGCYQKMQKESDPIQ